MPQFDCGQWKLRLERVPFPTDKQSANEHHSCEIETAIRNAFSYLLVNDFD